MEPQGYDIKRIQQEVTEIAEVLLREHPPGTPISTVWEDALTLHRVRYETEILPPPKDGLSHSRERHASSD